MGKVVIIGMGDDGLAGLTERARTTLANASLILGADASLSLLNNVNPETRCVRLSPDMNEAVAQVRLALDEPRPVLVSYGDPLFYGVARYLTERLGKDQFEILPHVSSMQLAFARIKESWDDAYLTSLSGRSVESILERVRTAEKVGLFSSPEMPPKRLAKILLENQIGAFRAYVCENLGQPDERVTLADLHDLQALDFDPLHVLILIRSGETRNEAAPARRRKLFGNPDELFAHNRPRRGLMTQCEARTLALSQLDIRPTSVVWDIGAGTGSVAIEAAQLADRGLVCAIEPDPTDLALAQSNAEKFGVTNIRWVAERAPQSLADLPGPDAVFVGATGRSVGTVVRAAFERLKTGGNLVLNIATLETVSATHQLLRELAGEVRLWQLSLARGIEQLDRVRFQAVNPTFLLAVTKQALPHPS